MIPRADSTFPAEPMRPTPFRIERRTRETPDTFTLELVPAEVACLFGFVPGQFNMLYVFGIGEVPISICGDPARPESLFHTIRDVGTVTSAIGALRRGATVGVRGPFGKGWPLVAAEGKDVLIIAGGIGLAPLRGALWHILANRPRYRNVTLLYGARSPADIIYRRELERFARRSALNVGITVDRADRDWQGKIGVVTALIARANFDPTNTIAMICGPEVMMRFTARELLARGVPEPHIHLSMERNMKCAIGFCGHCQFGPDFICKDGPIFRYDHLRSWLAIPEL